MWVGRKCYYRLGVVVDFDFLMAPWAMVFFCAEGFWSFLLLFSVREGCDVLVISSLDL